MCLSSPGDLSILSLAKCFRTVSSPTTISSISVVIFNVSNSGICPSVSLVKTLAKYYDRILALVLLSSVFSEFVSSGFKCRSPISSLDFDLM
jgi:hypothetical protein